MPGFMAALPWILNTAFLGKMGLDMFVDTPEKAQAKEKKKLMGVLADMASASDVVGRSQKDQGIGMQLALLQSLMGSADAGGYPDEAFVNDQIQTPENMQNILAMALGNQAGKPVDRQRVASMVEPERRPVYDKRLLPFADEMEYV